MIIIIYSLIISGKSLSTNEEVTDLPEDFKPRKQSFLQNRVIILFVPTNQFPVNGFGGVGGINGGMTLSS